MILSSACKQSTADQPRPVPESVEAPPRLHHATVHDHALWQRADGRRRNARRWCLDRTPRRRLHDLRDVPTAALEAVMVLAAGARSDCY